MIRALDDDAANQGGEARTSELEAHTSRRSIDSEVLCGST
jgi:hypothetical protein